MPSKTTRREARLLHIIRFLRAEHRRLVLDKMDLEARVEELELALREAAVA
jgi:hypothetical protein